VLGETTDRRLVERRLGLAEARRQGVRFEVAWPLALADALRGAFQWEADVYRAALCGTRCSWEAAYTGAPSTRLECAATELEAHAADAELDPLSHAPVV